MYVPQEEPFDIYSNALQQPPSNILYNDLSAACNYTSGFPADDNLLHDVTTPTFHPTYPSNEMQYNCSIEQASIQYPSQSSYKTPSYVQKISLDTLDSNNKRIRKKSTNGSVKLLSNKVKRIEEIINNFDKNLQKKVIAQDASNISLENLLKLSTQIYNNDKINSPDKNINKIDEINDIDGHLDDEIDEKPNLCPDCKETNGCVELLSNKVNRIEEIINNFDENLQKEKNTSQFSIFNIKFTLKNVLCELESDLSKFTLENLQKLVIFTTQNRNNDNNINSYDKNNEIDDADIEIDASIESRDTITDVHEKFSAYLPEGTWIDEILGNL